MRRGYGASAELSRPPILAGTATLSAAVRTFFRRAGDRNEHRVTGYRMRQMFQVIQQAGGNPYPRRGSPAAEGATIDNRQTSTRRQVGR
jgi:hypothetical protein